MAPDLPAPPATARAHAAAVAAGKTSAEAGVATVLARVEAIDRGPQGLNAYHEVFAEESLARAREIDARVRGGGRVGRLAGVTVAVKDNIATTLGRTTCSSRFLETYRSPFSATCVERLLAEDAIVLGKTNLDEFAMGSSGEHCAWGPVRNPHDPTRVPGGSSAGSAAAMGAGLCHAALGSDTGGSIRQPAAFCGCVGLKPSYGRVSRWGLVAFGSSLDQVGPLCKDTADAALLLEVIGGLDPRDSTSRSDTVPAILAAAESPEPARGLRVGVPVEYLDERNHPAVNASVRRVAELLEAQGASIERIALPLTELGISTYYVIAPAEASSNLARFDGIRYGRRAEPRAGEPLEMLYARSRAEGFGTEVQRRIMIGTYVLSAGYYDAYYRRALQVRRLIVEEYERAFRRCDLLLGPTAPTPAFALGGHADPLSMYLCDVYTVNASLAGLCAVSLPAGAVSEGGKSLPLAVQLQAPAGAEAVLMRGAALVEGVVGAGMATGAGP